MSSRNSLHFMEPEGLFPHPHMPATPQVCAHEHVISMYFYGYRNFVIYTAIRGHLKRFYKHIQLVSQWCHKLKDNTGGWQVLSPTRKETGYRDRRFWVSYILFIIIIGWILVPFIYITRLVSNEIFSPSNKIHREVGRAKDLSPPRYIVKIQYKS